MITGQLLHTHSWTFDCSFEKYFVCALSCFILRCFITSSHQLHEILFIFFHLRKRRCREGHSHSHKSSQTSCQIVTINNCSLPAHTYCFSLIYSLKYLLAVFLGSTPADKNVDILIRLLSDIPASHCNKALKTEVRSLLSFICPLF